MVKSKKKLKRNKYPFPVNIFNQIYNSSNGYKHNDFIETYGEEEQIRFSKPYLGGMEKYVKTVQKDNCTRYVLTNEGIRLYFDLKHQYETKKLSILGALTVIGSILITLSLNLYTMVINEGNQTTSEAIIFIFAFYIIVFTGAILVLYSLLKLLCMKI